MWQPGSGFNRNKTELIDKKRWEERLALVKTSLKPEELVLWSGGPEPGALFRCHFPKIILAILNLLPATLYFGIYTLYHISSGTSASYFGLIWLVLIDFLLIAHCYRIFSEFYILTNQRILQVQFLGPFFFMYDRYRYQIWPNDLRVITAEGGRGDIIFLADPESSNGYGNLTLKCLPEVGDVARVIRDWLAYESFWQKPEL